MEILDPKLQAYLDAHCDAEPEVLSKINRETHVKVLKANMLSGHYQGRLLSMLSKMVNPTNILEIGAFTGYSAICLAEGLADGGKLETIEVNAEMETMLRKNFEMAGVDDKINLHIGDAMPILLDFPDNYFNIVFIDADKKNNLNYFESSIQKVKPGGLIIIDNVLWKGKVYGIEKDADTESFRKLNDQVTVDNRVEKLILPIRDGILIIRKK
ncbi:O-methyltransferase [Mucilaginibacter sp. KACC 22063]|uniref:O-methyltransferase n=1 Tax=Mucilaginibacter sp. KACC 22063 TaxID=3025666 RepID=UPI002366CBBE|nr:O-methyltransferase [Mucilaginibacter sp. KACC 22063]WDF55529.1 O-methyltransferase [Mucilaginibacter sp. KACC 22063]